MIVCGSLEEEESEAQSISSSSESGELNRDDNEGENSGGKEGSATGNEGECVGLLMYSGNVGDVGDVVGVLRRTKLEMGVYAIRSGSCDAIRRTRRLGLCDSVETDNLRPVQPLGEEGEGEIESARRG